MDGHQRQNSRSRADSEFNLDFVSSLPTEIIEKNLVKLPTREAIRTSILSSKWKYSWASIPDLVFNENTTESSKLMR
ncbi:F-box family protein [Rhynchospora pubera]|uniref:F-box family protein n=1 Tax=Rhynchospora pubera TaxID=906938 RepID=A0AAV8GF75_9POAL|nr:F-box family protein [Rhynchospora pubera]